MKAFKIIVTILLCIIFAVAGFIAGFYIKYTLDKKAMEGDVYVSGELQIHFLELGNYYTGDCTFIDTGMVEVLIDAGSRKSSVETIYNYVNPFCEDGKIEYVIVTHAHEDHYAGFAAPESVFNRFEIGTIIDFATTKEGKTTDDTYLDYQRELAEAVSNGATHYTAKQCVDETDGAKQTYELTKNITMTILETEFYTNGDDDNENNNSVCTLISQNDSRHFLFTGDLDLEGEESLAELNDLPEVDIYKAGHHGSGTSSNNVLLDKIKPKHVGVCCCAGSDEYTKTKDNQFPTQEFIDRIAPHTDKVYVTTLAVDLEANTFTSMNGNIKFISKSKGITVECSNNNTLLKDTAWFKANRRTPVAWQ